MINTSYQFNRLFNVGNHRFPYNNLVNNQKFSLGVIKNENINVSDTGNVEDIISNLEKGNKDTINTLETLGLNYSLTEYHGGYKVKFEQDGNTYTVAYNGNQTVKSNVNEGVNTSEKVSEEEQLSTQEVQSLAEEEQENSYESSLNDLFTSIERMDSENKYTAFSNDLSLIKENIESYKTIPNADTEVYEALEDSINQIRQEYDSINTKKKELLDTKEKIQAEMNDLKIPEPPSKEDNTKLLSDGTESVDEEKYAAALEQYEKDRREYNKNNEYLINQMNSVVNQLGSYDFKISQLESNKNAVRKDFSAVSKLQEMINNENNSGIVEYLKENQKELSKNILKNIQIGKVNDIYNSLFFEMQPSAMPSRNDYTYINEKGETVTDDAAYNLAYIKSMAQKEIYNAGLSAINQLVAEAQVQNDKNSINIESILFDSEKKALINELDINGTGSEQMSQFIIDSTNEYNQILQSKLKEQQNMKNIYAENIKVPNAPKTGDYDSEEEMEQAVNTYYYQRAIYEKQLQEQELSRQLSETRIQKMDERLEEIRKLLFSSHT